MNNNNNGALRPVIRRKADQTPAQRRVTRQAEEAWQALRAFNKACGGVQNRYGKLRYR